MKFLEALRVFLRMYRQGFYFSENMHPNLGGGSWGFYRFNHTDQPSLFDIDLDFDREGYGYFHIHGDDFRLTKVRDGQVSKAYAISRIGNSKKKGNA